MLRVHASGVVEAHGAYTGRKPASPRRKPTQLRDRAAAGRDDLAALRFLTEIFLGASPGLQVRGKPIPFVAGRSPALEVGVLGRRCIA